MNDTAHIRGDHRPGENHFRRVERHEQSDPDDQRKHGRYLSDIDPETIFQPFPEEGGRLWQEFKWG